MRFLKFLAVLALLALPGCAHAINSSNQRLWVTEADGQIVNNNAPNNNVRVVNLITGASAYFYGPIIATTFTVIANYYTTGTITASSMTLTGSMAVGGGITASTGVFTNNVVIGNSFYSSSATITGSVSASAISAPGASSVGGVSLANATVGASDINVAAVNITASDIQSATLEVSGALSSNNFQVGTSGTGLPCPGFPNGDGGSTVRGGPCWIVSDVTNFIISTNTANPTYYDALTLLLRDDRAAKKPIGCFGFLKVTLSGGMDFEVTFDTATSANTAGVYGVVVGTTAVGGGAVAYDYVATRGIVPALVKSGVNAGDKLSTSATGCYAALGNAANAQGKSLQSATADGLKMIYLGGN